MLQFVQLSLKFLFRPVVLNLLTALLSQFNIIAVDAALKSKAADAYKGQTECMCLQPPSS